MARPAQFTELGAHRWAWHWDSHSCITHPPHRPLEDWPGADTALTGSMARPGCRAYWQEGPLEHLLGSGLVVLPPGAWGARVCPVLILTAWLPGCVCLLCRYYDCTWGRASTRAATSRDGSRGTGRVQVSSGLSWLLQRPSPHPPCPTGSAGGWARALSMGADLPGCLPAEVPGGAQ